ncbi:LuxR C-terminal-related transcriptional regulator [Streptomyces sp. NPDC087212]|uniref:LuxR C-terminal-related transcriptional regulator n=1 Tax=Streptomyces sp. NPDC087212 TaxID=3365766 RepID=UPI0038022307
MTGSRPITEPGTDVLDVIAETGRRGPLLVTADDVCRADAGSLRALRRVLEESSRLPVVVAVSAQRGRPPRAPAELAQLMHGMEQLVLDGLSEQESADLARGALGRRTRPESVAVCHRLTAGNPLLLTELLRWGTGAGHLAWEELTLADAPALPAVADAAARCLNLVDPALLKVVTLIAVTGESDPDALPLLADLSGLTLEETLAAADRLVRLGFIADDGTLALRHPLLAQALAGGTTAMARSAAHLGTAAYLHRHGAPIQRTARHLVAASVRSDDTWPADVLLAAARGAARADDHATALHFTDHTLRTANGESYLRAVLLACDIRLLTDWRAGVDLALANLRELRTDDARVPLLHRLGGALRTSVPDPATTARVLAVVRATLAGSGLARWDRLHRVADGMCATTVDRSVELLDAVVAGDAVGPAGAPPAGPAIVLAVDAFKALFADLAGRDSGEAVRQARRALDGFERTPSPHPMTVPLALIVLVQNGLHEEAAARAQSLGPGAEDRLRPDGAALLVDALIALGQGRPDTARVVLEQLLRVLPTPEQRLAVPLRMTAVGLLAGLLAELGDGDAAWKLLETQRCTGELEPGWLCRDVLLARAGLRAAAGDLDGAAVDLKDLLRRASSGGVRLSSLLAWRRHGVARLWQCGLLAEADAAAAEQLQLAEKSHLPLELGRALRAQARLDDGPRAERLLREAIELLQSGDGAGDLDLAHAQADLGALLMRHGEPDRAVTALVAAVGLAHRCGARPVAEQATALLAAADRQPAPHTPLRGVFTLTQRERQIFLMATRGTSNRRIAEVLEITRRTVELHLSSAYRKLGISGRRDFPELLSVPGVGPMLEVGADSACPAAPSGAAH